MLTQDEIRTAASAARTYPKGYGYVLLAVDEDWICHYAEVIDHMKQDLTLLSKG